MTLPLTLLRPVRSTQTSPRQRRTLRAALYLLEVLTYATALIIALASGGLIASGQVLAGITSGSVAYLAALGGVSHRRRRGALAVLWADWPSHIAQANPTGFADAHVGQFDASDRLGAIGLAGVGVGTIPLAVASLVDRSGAATGDVIGMAVVPLVFLGLAALVWRRADRALAALR